MRETVRMYHIVKGTVQYVKEHLKKRIWKINDKKRIVKESNINILVLLRYYENTWARGYTITASAL